MMAAAALVLGPLWPLLAGAACLGLAIGAATSSERGGGAASVAALFVYAAVLGLGATAAVQGWLPGRYGLWLEMAMPLFAAYLSGCVLGYLVWNILRRISSPSGSGGATR